MEIYYVGGCVRDQLLGMQPKDIDYLVVGSTVEDMLRSGFQQVGADFPVFLNPTTNEEYALARTERKTGKGYSGFEVDASPTVTLVEDLRRRDLTINAMAINVRTGELHDPYGGQQDLYDGVIRHVSEAFAEDPLRTLRAARFAARYDFKVSPYTMEMISAVAPELEHVSRERIATEMYKILNTPRVRVAYNVLSSGKVFDVPCVSKFDSERLDMIERMGDEGFLMLTPGERFALLSEQFSKEDMEQAHIPSAHSQLATVYNASIGPMSYYDSLQPEHRIALFNHFRAFSTSVWLESCLTVMTAAKQISTPTSNRIRFDLKKAKSVDVSDAPNQAKGAAIRTLVDSMRANAL